MRASGVGGSLRTLLVRQWLLIVVYLVSIMGYFGVSKYMQRHLYIGRERESQRERERDIFIYM